MPTDSFAENITGVSSLIGDDTNKVQSNEELEEGVSGDYEDILELPMEDADLLSLRDEWENKSAGYLPKIKLRQDRNRTYLKGTQKNQATQSELPVATNLLFEATATFVPQALAQNPEPVVFSDNTNEGKEASNEVKTMLQYHADVLCLRKKLGTMVWHWSNYFTGIAKHGWDAETNEIKTEVRNPKQFILDPDGYVDEFGDYKGDFLGEKMEKTAEWFIEQFPKHKEYIVLKVNGKLGTKLTATEWWTDKYCFTTLMEVVLDKHKNEFFNYETTEKGTDEFGNETQTATPAINHFAMPKMPYTFLSVFSLQEEPYDFTNLIEQNISNQDRISERDEQVDKNLRSAQNSIALSGQSFTEETAGQASQSFYEEGMLLIPDGNMDAVKRIPASPLPNGLLESQMQEKTDLRSIYGTLGLSAQPQNEDTTARGQILNQNHDSSRIGGGVGDALEQVADNIFNWWVQLYCVFYDEPHYAAVMGNGRAVEYIQLMSSNFERRFVISVSPNSMKPKDEVTEQNMSVELANAGWLDPINLFKRLDDPDPMNTAKMVTIFRTNPQLYMQMFFPEAQPPMGMGAPSPAIPDQGGTPSPSLAAPASSSSLSQVPLATQASPSI